jgi:putative transcriptional regulator
MTTDGSPKAIGPIDQIHNRLRVLRAERGLSRQDLATAVGVNYQTIGYLERGDYSPSLELAFRFSQFFALPIEAIFSLQPFPPLSSAVYRNQGPHPVSGMEEA